MIHQALYSSRSEEWPTPQDFFDRLDREFDFTLDPCGTPENAKCSLFFTRVANLAKGRIGEDSSSLLGGLLITTIGLAAYTRADISPDRRRDFFVYVDEVQSFTTLALANMLSELRKYRVGFTIAHQYLQQLSPEIRHAVLGNIGTIISFRVGAEDGPYLAKEFQEEFDAMDLIRLANYRVYIKLMIDGTLSKPFSAATDVPRRAH